MTRTIVDIPVAQLVEIDRLCRLMGISRAEAVRRALVAFADGHADVTPEAFGLWRRHADAVAPPRTAAPSAKPKPQPALAPASRGTVRPDAVAVEPGRSGRR